MSVGFAPSDGNGRYGDGSGGPETRYHFPMVDSARFDEATEGSVDTAPQSGEAVHVVESDINTMGGGARGRLGGTMLPPSDQRGGFC